MAETVGSLIDKITIVELRRWHTEEVMMNADAPVDLRHDCALRLKVLDEHRDDLCLELSTLWVDIVEGRHVPKLYRPLDVCDHDILHDATTNREAEPVESGNGPEAQVIRLLPRHAQ